MRESLHKEFIWPHFVDNLPPSYEFFKSKLQDSKDPLTRMVLENAQQSRHNVQSGGEKMRTILEAALIVLDLKADQGAGRGGGRGGSNRGKLDNSGRSEGLLSQAKLTCSHCQKPRHI